MKHLTVRGVPPDVAEALDAEKKRRGESLNKTVIQLLRVALRLSPEPYDNGLGRFAGKWTEEDLEDFERKVADLVVSHDDVERRPQPL